MRRTARNMWSARNWVKLLDWLGEQRVLARTMIRRRVVRGRICDALSPHRLPQLSWHDLAEVFWRFGTVESPDGRVLVEEELAVFSPEELAERLASGALIVTGNQTLGGGGDACNVALPGLDDQELARLRTALGSLLHGCEDPAEMVDELAEQSGALTPACASLALCMIYPDRYGIWHETRVRGAEKLAWLLGAEDRWARSYDSYRAFNGLLHELWANSEGALEDLLGVDALLCYLAQMREPRYWKIAIALTQPEAEAEAVAARCLRRGFAAVNGDKRNIARLRQVLPGDYVVMHLRGRIGGVGRVVRPYYQLDPEHAGVLDGDWPHRVDVDWVPGERCYGALLTGAQQRFTVVPLSERVFWQLAQMYEDVPDYAPVLRPQRRAWLFVGDQERCAQLTTREKPLPLRGHWRIQTPAEPLRTGNSVLAYRRGAGGGICALSKVLGVVTEPPRGTRVDLLHEQHFDPPVSLTGPKTDERIAEVQRLIQNAATPGPLSPVLRLSGGQTAAVRKLLGIPEDRYFVLMAERQRQPMLRRRTVYRYRHDGPGQPQELTEAAHWARANCLIYHAGPEYAFAGFGPVIDAQDEPDAPGAEHTVKITVAVQRFTAPAQIGSFSADWRRRLGGLGAVMAGSRAVTVLPISARDYYRVVAAGLGVAQVAAVAADIAAFADECCIPVPVARELERLLREHGQMVFYGPPGTGKTWIALRLADYLAGGDPQRQEVVQFHPAYSYEDFMEGIRPEPVEGPDGRMEISYPVVPGVFVRFCERARLDPNNTYIFVIDEINRAQISKVFGELMLLLEYRGRRARLASSRAPGDFEDWPLAQPEGFAVPENVLLVGTMNTADRSIALVDHALRRRFLFYPFFPDDNHFLRPMLCTWLARHAPEMLWVADLLDETNARLAEEVGRGLLIGPSYFMRPDLDEARLREVWRFQIIPLLEEYFAGMPEGLGEYELDRLINRVRGPDYPVLGRENSAGERG